MIPEDFPDVSQIQPFVNVPMSTDQIIETLSVDRLTIGCAQTHLVRVPRRRQRGPCRPLYKLIRFDNGCWKWMAARHPDGYGNICVDARTLPAHKFFYMLFIGPVPVGMECCHTCDTPECVNPDHLFLGTHLDNMKDMAEKQRSTIGERHSKAKLSDEAVRVIRQSTESTSALAATFGVHANTINEVRARRRWQHVTD